LGLLLLTKFVTKSCLKKEDKVVEYDTKTVAPPDTAKLNPNHSHFVLVESDNDEWGEEMEARSDFEEFICNKFNIPLCLLVVNGGPNTLETVADGVQRKFPVVIFEGTGRAADAIAGTINFFCDFCIKIVCTNFVKITI